MLQNFWGTYFKELGVMGFANHDETKYFADFINPPRSCSIVTLGTQ